MEKQTPSEEQLLPEDFGEVEEPEAQTVQIPVVWRIVAIVVAVGIIGVLLWPTISQRGGLSSLTDILGSGGNESDATQETALDTLFRQGQEQYQAMQWDQAIATYQQIISQDPTYQSAYVNLGTAYFQINQINLAIENYQKAVDLAPDDAEVAYNLGAAYLRQAMTAGQLNQAEIDKAITQIEQAIELDPELPHPYYGLGAAYRILGDQEKAIQYFEKFLEIDDGSDSQATTEARTILGQLKTDQE